MHFKGLERASKFKLPWQIAFRFYIKSRSTGRGASYKRLGYKRKWWNRILYCGDICWEVIYMFLYLLTVFYSDFEIQSYDRQDFFFLGGCYHLLVSELIRPPMVTPQAYYIHTHTYSRRYNLVHQRRGVVDSKSKLHRAGWKFKEIV